jgi:hypothetical protein
MFKMCQRCRRPVPTSEWERHQQQHRNHGKPSSTARGYDSRHERLRAEWGQLIATGFVHCVRCGLPIGRDEPWDLGHDDFDRSRHTGPEHEACNAATASHHRI